MTRCQCVYPDKCFCPQASKTPSLAEMWRKCYPEDHENGTYDVGVKAIIPANRINLARICANCNDREFMFTNDYICLFCRWAELTGVDPRKEADLPSLLGLK